MRITLPRQRRNVFFSSARFSRAGSATSFVVSKAWSIFVFVLFTPLLAHAEAAAEEDPIKAAILSYITMVQHEVGDYVVGVTALLMLLAIWKKMFRAAVGLLILILGIVLLRVLISALF